MALTSRRDVMFEAVLFDWDGTLADTRSAILLSFKKALSRINVEVPDEFIVRRIGIGAENTFKEILQAEGVDFDDAIISSLIQEKISAEINLSETISLLPGALALLQSLYRKLPLGLASMNNAAVIDHLLGKLRLRHLFSAIITVEGVSHFKPHPEIFLKCASLLDVPPKQCLVVEDSVFGVQAAKAAGMSCLAVSTGAYKMDELADHIPDMLVSSLSETERILSFIFQ